MILWVHIVGTRVCAAWSMSKRGPWYKLWFSEAKQPSCFNRPDPQDNDGLGLRIRQSMTERRQCLQIPYLIWTSVCQDIDGLSLWIRQSMTERRQRISRSLTVQHFNPLPSILQVLLIYINLTISPCTGSIIKAHNVKLLLVPQLFLK